MPMQTIISKTVLSSAMHRPIPPDQLTTIDANHFPVWEAVTQYSQSFSIRILFIGRHQHHLICDVEVRVACGHSTPLDGELLRHGKSEDGKRRTLFIFHHL